MTKEEILEGSKLMAEFMGLPIKKREWDDKEAYLWHDNYWRIAEKLKYNTSWDWLMPVVERIESFAPTIIEIACNECIIRSDKRFREHGETKIEATWIAIVKFIKWYNPQPKQK